MENKMDRPTRYAEFEVSGTPRELGRQIGEAGGEKVAGFCEIALTRVNQSIKISRTKAREIADGCIAFAEAYSPDMMEELRGTAEAAKVSLTDLMLLQVRNQLRAEADAGCTSFSLTSAVSPTGGAVVAQNWDADPALDEFTIVLTRRPTGKPALMCVTQAGLIAYIGFNDRGLGLCLNTLPAPSRTLGVPHYFTVRGIYESSSLAEAVRAVERAERAIPANIILTTPDQGPVDLEVTLTEVNVLRASDSGELTHTNHCLHPNLVPINQEFPELIQSHARLERVGNLLESGERTLGDLQATLRDHNGHPRSICRHTNDDAENGFWQTVFSVIIQPSSRTMYVTRGTPCDHPYETYTLESH